MKTRILLIVILSIGITSIKAQTPGNSLHFDGTNDYVTTSLPSVFTNLLTNDFTVEAWIKPQGTSFSRVLFAQQSTSNFFSLTLSTSNQIYFYLNNTVGEITSTTLTTGQWAHVACTWQASTSQAKIYINGVLQTTSSGGGSSTGSNNTMSIGSRTDGNQYFNGELDELRIWDVARNQCEISISMNSEYTIPQTNLVAYYNFNQGVAGSTNTTVNTLNDFTTNYNGTLNNFSLSGSGSNWLASNAVINSVNQISTFYSTDYVTACDSFLWIDGITYTANNNTATDTLTSSLGCDSIITLNLTINNSKASIDTQTACNSFLWINGITYTASNNTATHTLSTTAGCDSIVTLDLTINTVDVSVTNADPSITANEIGADYQWLDCNNNYSVLIADTLQNFTASANGDYAVEVTKNGCTDTSICITISSVGIKENNLLKDVSFFPNPNQGIVNVNLGGLDDVSIKVYSINGELIYSAANIKSLTHKFEFNEAPGVYLIEISTKNEKQLYQMLKE